MLDWRRYWAILRRRWLIVAVILVVDVLAAGYLFAKSTRSAGYQACTTLYVADTSAASMITAPSTSLQGLGQLLSGETAANFFADDILDVAQSRSVASSISASLAAARRPHTAFDDINGSVSGSRVDRTVSLCVTNPDSGSATAAARQLGIAMSKDRARFVGIDMAKRTYVAVISDPSVGPAPVSRSLLNLGLRFFLGVLFALGVALLWDAVDPKVRDREDVERALGAPVLGSSG
jgi:capsular polysaccharide biosynthesis protein